MTALKNIFGSSDGVSMQSHAAMKEAGVGKYDTPPPPPPPPPPNYKVGAPDLMKTRRHPNTGEPLTEKEYSALVEKLKGRK